MFYLNISKFSKILPFILSATKYSFSFTSSNKFWTRLIIIYQACFHIMTQKMTGSVELNRHWELYFFTHLFSSTGPWWLLVLWLQFNINEICMNIDFTVTALMFPTIPLLMSVYANRFHTLSALIRREISWASSNVHGTRCQRLGRGFNSLLPLQ